MVCSVTIYWPNFEVIVRGSSCIWVLLVTTCSSDSEITSALSGDSKILVYENLCPKKNRQLGTWLAYTSFPILQTSIRIRKNKYSGKGKTRQCNYARSCFRSIRPTRGCVPGWRLGWSGRLFFLGAIVLTHYRNPPQIIAVSRTYPGTLNRPRLPACMPVLAAATPVGPVHPTPWRTKLWMASSVRSRSACNCKSKRKHFTSYHQ